jgi:hypothetical protein
MAKSMNVWVPFYVWSSSLGDHYIGRCGGIYCPRRTLDIIGLHLHNISQIHNNVM